MKNALEGGENRGRKSRSRSHRSNPRKGGKDVNLDSGSGD